MKKRKHDPVVAEHRRMRRRDTIRLLTPVFAIGMTGNLASHGWKTGDMYEFAAALVVAAALLVGFFYTWQR